MGMKFGNVDIPEELLRAQQDGKLVIFAGAGVSKPHPSNLPLFSELTKQIAKDTSIKRENKEPLDRYLGRLEDNGTKVHEIAQKILSSTDSQPNDLHNDIVRLSKDRTNLKIITTNYDTHLTTTATALLQVEPHNIFYAPALPEGDNFSGIVYLHGSVKQEPDKLILTDRDFGKAYLSKGWATKFLCDVFIEYTVLFIGYSHNDTDIYYLARGLSDRALGKRFALSKPNEEQKWENLGITPICPINDKSDCRLEFKLTLHEWAEHTAMDY